MALSTPAGRTAELLRDQTSLSVNHKTASICTTYSTKTKTQTNTQVKTKSETLRNSRTPEGPNITVCQSQDCFHMYYILYKDTDKYTGKDKVRNFKKTAEPQRDRISLSVNHRTASICTTHLQTQRQRQIHRQRQRDHLRNTHKRPLRDQTSLFVNR